MAQNTTTTSSIVSYPDGATLSAKPSDTFHPHYFTTFQNFSCGPKASSTEPPQNKALLPIPKQFKDETEDLVNAINRLLIEDLTKISEFTSVIPNIFFEQADNFITHRYLIDRTMYRAMNEGHIINWMSSLKKLYPIRTSGNGNCLLHAVLIAMVGIHDLNLYLRDRLVQFMEENKTILKNHWRIERLKSDKNYGIQSEDSKLDSEWEELCNIVRYENSEDGQTATHLQFLESVHIFSISNMLRRPIIVLSEDVIRNKNGEAISPNDLFGIYLPILSTPSECLQEPIVLIYDQSHFCSLQASDLRTGKTSDNLLPLYPSIDHTYDQTLLPTRFLGNDVNEEQANNLLHEYLRIQKVSYSFDSNSPPLSILCAELGSKNLSPRDNFFLLFHKYVMDFFQIQKPKALEEERRLKEKRELDEYISRHTSYSTGGRSITKPTVALSSPLPSFILPRLTNTNPSRNQNDRLYEHESSYDDPTNNGSYIPNGSAYYIENHQPQRPIAYATTKQPDTSASYILSSDSRQPSPKEEPRTDTRISIPVRHLSSSSARSDFIDTERRASSIRKCVLCDHLFDDLLSKRFCSECDHKLQYAEPDHAFTSRSRATNMYLPARNNGYAPVLSPAPKIITARRTVLCPYCKNPNLIDSGMRGSDYYCSACRNLIPSGYF